MSDRDALLAAILANPDEDTPRLMLADWLQENGDAKRAEFIRTQIDVAREFAAEADLPESFGTTCAGGYEGYNIVYRPHDLPERLALLGKESKLLHKHGAKWQKGLPTYATNAQTGRFLKFRRGFVGHVQVSLGPLMKAPAALWKQHPVESLALPRASGDARLKVPKCKPLAALRDLHLTGEHPVETLITPFADCPHLSNLRVLNLGYADLLDGAARVLARSHMRPVEFGCGTQALGEAAFSALLNSAFASRLRRFAPYAGGTRGAEVIAGAPLGELRRLDLSGGNCGDAGVVALTRSKHLTKLVTLDLGYNQLTDSALEVLAAWPGLSSVQSLNLGDNQRITGRGVSALLKAPHLRPIHIGLRWTATGNEGAKALAKWPGLANLIDLDLSHAQVADAGVVALADSPHWRDIRYLKLSGPTKIGQKASARIRQRIGGRKIDIWGY